MAKQSAEQLLKTRNPVYYAINTQLRNDAARFTSVKNWQALDDKTYARIKDYFQYHQAMIAMHWHNAEEHFVPVLARFLPDNPKVQSEWENELSLLQKELGQSQARIVAAFAANQKDVGDLMKKYVDLLLAYMPKEEQYMTDTLAGLDKAKFDEIEKAIIKEQDPKEMRGISEWLFAGMDDQMRADFFAKTSFFLPFLWKYVLQGRFNKRIAVFKQFE